MLASGPNSFISVKMYLLEALSHGPGLLGEGLASSGRKERVYSRKVYKEQTILYMTRYNDFSLAPEVIKYGLNNG